MGAGAGAGVDAGAARVDIHADVEVVDRVPMRVLILAVHVNRVVAGGSDAHEGEEDQEVVVEQHELQDEGPLTDLGRLVVEPAVRDNAGDVRHGNSDFGDSEDRRI